MSRSSARESVFKLVFEYLFNKEKDIDLLEEIINDEKNKNEIGYIKEVYNGVVSHHDEIIEEIKKVSEGFKIDRIFKVDLAILVVAIYEMKYVSSIPNRVSVNEALNLAKMYSTEKSNSFINGILSNFMGE